MTQTPTEKTLEKRIEQILDQCVDTADTTECTHLTEEEIGRLGAKILQALKEPVVIEGITYIVKLVPVEWVLKQDSQHYAFSPEFNHEDINSQIKEL